MCYLARTAQQQGMLGAVAVYLITGFTLTKRLLFLLSTGNENEKVTDILLHVTENFRTAFETVAETCRKNPSKDVQQV